MVLDLIWRHYDIAFDFLRRERKGESDFGFALSCTSGQLKNDNFGVWIWEGKVSNIESAHKILGLRRLSMLDGYGGSTPHGDTSQLRQWQCVPFLFAPPQKNPSRHSPLRLWPASPKVRQSPHLLSCRTLCRKVLGVSQQSETSLLLLQNQSSVTPKSANGSSSTLTCYSYGSIPSPCLPSFPEILLCGRFIILDSSSSVPS